MGLLLSIVFLLHPVQQTPGNFWHVLAEVGFNKTKDVQGYDIEQPVFSKHLKSYHGKKISLKGYLIPMSEVTGRSEFMFSSLPFNVCYFCGAAGPETVVELQNFPSHPFTTKAIVLEGILLLNEKDPDHHIYILKSPKILK